MNTETLEIQYGREYEIKDVRNTLFAVFKNGKVFRWIKGGYWKSVYPGVNKNDGYNQICVGRKQDNNLATILRHRLMAYAFLNLDIENPKMEVDHIDGNRINNHINNLRVVNRQQNQWNQTKAKGYIYLQKLNKYRSQIGVDYKLIYLGFYDTEEEAHQAYLNAKIIYHPI